MPVKVDPPPSKSPSQTDIHVGPPALQVAPSPHISDTSVTTRGMMYDVLYGLVPVILAALAFFHWYAIVQIGLCLLACLAAEWIFSWMRGQTPTLWDGSAAVTGVILGLSLPWSAPWYIPVIGSFAAIGIGKAAFGGLGYNLFNPAMVGRAFVTLSFALELSSSAYVQAGTGLEIVTQATPLTAAKMQIESSTSLLALLFGNHNGSLGETSVLACLVGGLFLCYRKSAAWQIPAAVILSTIVLGGALNLIGATPVTLPDHLLGGSLFFGAFFIATDPVTSPLVPKGKVIFGVGVGIFIVLIRVFSSYAEGVMFAVLLMNAATPLINRWTIPRPLGCTPVH